ncbi:MAG: dTDP-glucose 4,6-dehydratase [Lactobacillus sp.]|jgi:dTDP-glucose 4,6-dehydratase|nr:dTDP-glucose 4,6-dehydratase [Lactobacillus sp.]
MKAILVTGGAGFIGGNFVPYFAEKYPEYKVINLDKLTYAGDLENLKECEGMSNYEFVQGDICDRALIEKIFKENNVQGVIHFAAESHVDNSITGPKAFIETNVMGTFMLLDVARNTWLEAPHKVRAGYENARFHHISTDEVYGTLGETGLFTETTPYAPNSPYSASKASSDLLVRAYFHTYGMNVTTSNCSNNYGPKQHVEKLIPKIISNCVNGKPIPIYGDGKNIRDWLYVLDHCKAIDLVFHDGKAGETYNVGGRNERNNLQIVNTICEILDNRSPRKEGGSYKELITFVEDRAGHDRRYAIDATKLESELGWKADENFETGIVLTIDWYLEKFA